MELQNMSYFLTFKYIKKKFANTHIFTTSFLIYKTFDIYTECSKEMLNTVVLEFVFAT